MKDAVRRCRIHTTSCKGHVQPAHSTGLTIQHAAGAPLLPSPVLGALNASKTSQQRRISLLTPRNSAWRRRRFELVQRNGAVVGGDSQQLVVM